METPRALDRLAQDVRYALRTLRRSPGFTAVAIATLAFGIGVNTAMFSVVDAVLLRPLPYPDAGHLVTVRQAFPKAGEVSLGAAPAEYLDYRHRTRVFSSVAGFEAVVFDLTGAGEPVRVSGVRATHDLFSTLGVPALLDRTFAPDEDRAGAAKVVVLGYDLWQRRFGARAETIGATVKLSEQPYTVIGVMPRGFEFPLLPTSVGEPPALWVPMAFSAKEIAERGAEFPVGVVARLRPGITREEAERDVRRVADEFQRERPDLYSGNVRLQVDLDTLGARGAAGTRPLLFTLAGAVAFLLLIACANVASLLLARAAVRDREIAVRSALGASGARLAAQLLTETAVLAAAGAALGGMLAEAIVHGLGRLWAAPPAGLAAARLDPAVFAFLLAVAGMAAVLCGLVPALGAARPDLVTALRAAGSAGGSRERHRMHAGLVVAETTSALVLLVGAGLFLHSLAAVLRVRPGFDPEGVLLARTTFNRQRYPSGDRRREAEKEMARRLGALPGVTAVAVTTHLPLADARQIGFILEGEDARAVRWADNALVSGEYFRVMGIPLRRGRTFGPEDAPDRPGVAIVNESMARRLWGAVDPVGRRVEWGGRKLTIVGIAGDVHVQALDAAVSSTIYTPVYQTESGATTSAVFVLHTDRSRAAVLAPSIRDAIWSVDPDVPVFGIQAMGDIVARSVGTRRFAVVMSSAFAGAALLLAVLGLHGVLSYAVAARRAEMALRFALGAQPAQVVGLVVGSGMRMAAAGAALGLLTGAAAARAVSSLLFVVRPYDAFTYLGAAAVLLGVALAASLLPARRAARIDPMTVLRSE